MDEQGEGPGPDRRWWRSGNIVAICLAFALPLVLAVLGGSALAVPIVYAVLFVEGDVLIYLIVGSARDSGAIVRSAPRSQPTMNHSFVRADRVDTLTSLVKWASKGSDYSRREIAETCARVLARRFDSSSGVQTGPSVRTMEALRAIVYPYRDDPAVKSELGTGTENHAGDDTRVGRGLRLWPDRGRYLSNLEALVSGLEQEFEP